MPYPTRLSDHSHVSGKYVLTSTAGLKASGLAPRPGTTSTLLSMSTATVENASNDVVISNTDVYMPITGSTPDRYSQ